MAIQNIIYFHVIDIVALLILNSIKTWVVSSQFSVVIKT